MTETKLNRRSAAVNKALARKVTPLAFPSFSFPTGYCAALSISILLTFASGASAHPSSCSLVQFRSVVSTSLNPTPTTRLNLVRQRNGSYTAYETANTNPYTLVSVSRNFAEQLTACSTQSWRAYRPSSPLIVPGDPVGSSSQVQAVARLRSGSYLVVTINPGIGGVDAAVFDRDMSMVSVTNYPFFPQELALADLNGDGNPDLVTVTSGGIKGSLELHILLGTGGSNFQAPIIYTIPSNNPVLGAFAIGDLNGDKSPDIAVAVSSALGNFSSGSVITLLGNGDGTFRTGSSLPVGSQLDSITLVDLNGDGRLDFATSGGRLGTLGGGQVAVALGNGDGSFSPPSFFNCSPVNNANSIAIGDMNGDGIPDIVTIGTVLFGDGTGSFSARQDYVVPSQLPGSPGAVILADFNGDGRIDIVVAGGTPAFITGNTLTVLLGLPDGTFLAPPATVVPGSEQPGYFWTDLRAADFNGDGIPDLVYVGDYAIGVMLGKGDGTFLSSFSSTLSQASLGQLATGDFDRDGNQDFVVLFNNLGRPGILAFYAGKGDGTFQPPVTLSLPRGPVTLAAGDFNGDGKLDLAVLFSALNGGASDTVILYVGNGDGSFRQGASYPVGPNAYWLIAGDLNHDGKLDLVVSNSGTDLRAGNVSTLLGKGDGTFVAGGQAGPLSVSFNGTSSSTMTLADFNQDGNLDLAVIVSDGNSPGVGFAVLFGKGDGTFQAPIVNAIPAVTGIAAIDLNGHGIADLMISASPAHGQQTPIGLGYLPGNGDGTFQAEVPLNAPSGGSLVIADLNGDGTPDVLGLDLEFFAMLNLTRSRHDRLSVITPAARTLSK